MAPVFLFSSDWLGAGGPRDVKSCRMSASEKAIIRAQLALVKATEGSFAAAHRCLYRWDDHVSVDAGLQQLDEGVQQLRVITNLLVTTARRVAVGQQQTIDVLRSPSKRRHDAATGVTEEDVTPMAFLASMEVCLRIVASND